jgi:hypothetical protein
MSTFTEILDRLVGLAEVKQDILAIHRELEHLGTILDTLTQRLFDHEKRIAQLEPKREPRGRS